VTSIAWFPHSCSQLAIGTGYHQYRLYDLKKAKRPILSIEIGQYPLKSLEFISETNIILSDTIGNLCILDSCTGKKIKQIKGIAGAVTQVSSTSDYVLSVGFDRFLRLYKNNTSFEFIEKVYLKQRLNAIVVMNESIDTLSPLKCIDEKKEIDTGEESSASDIWEELQEIQEPLTKKLKKK
jgi:ribosome biogenesis protein NSA1